MDASGYMSFPMTRGIVCLCILAWLAGPVRADEQVRQVQEELRKRNLYFGDIDGQSSPELAGALKRYQARKGFEVTGAVDDETASSLHVGSSSAAMEKKPAGWPDLPVLRSDVARELPAAQRIALQKQGEESPDPSPGPQPPAESPAQAQDLTPERVNKFVADYLRGGETPDVSSQLRFYAFPVEYFDHGPVGEPFVVKDARNYENRWPDRKYMLTGPVTFFASGKEGETLVEFTIAFNVRNKKHEVSGRTKNFWTIRPEGDDLKIIAIREQRLRE